MNTKTEFRTDEAGLKLWAEEEEKNPELMWEKIYDAIADPIFILDSTGLLLSMNKASEELLEVKFPDIKGSRCYEIVHKTATFIDGCPFRKSMKSGERESYKLQIGTRWYRVSVDPIKNSGGDVIGAVHIITDIDELIKTHAKRAQLGAVIENTGEAVIGTDPDGIIESWNNGAEEIFGFTEDEITGKPFLKLIKEDHTDEPEEIMRDLKKNYRTSGREWKMIRKDGSEIEIELSFSPIYDERGVFYGASYIGHNIGPQRLAERELLAYMTESFIRMKKPVEIINSNLSEISELYEKDEISADDTNEMIKIQIKNAEQILANLYDLNRKMVEKKIGIPDEYCTFFLENENK
ncbi:PAS domain-containing protein [Methanoplanus endosymbiosus]|uniref:PAS domain S-box protein n=1 Tax=Methanoplanus endosymbiosus TaxID=33865 RepID=A0A9E7PRG2_9EURY|nr:PAS domain S-box protein [Methanoplanus endosymbiosus]UUX93759.1 PAS domain S-box protein [Methanoplanus endosymbiosus]